MALEHLGAPPINEVVCGVVFEPLQLDPVRVGLYWPSRRDTYDKVELHPGISDAPEIFIAGVPPIRTWLVSKEDDFVLQLQHDRVYLNWRRRGRKYPRFHNHDGGKGVLARFADEFARFGEFCKKECGTAPRPLRTELSKIDMLIEKEHWEGVSDLKALLPWLGQFVSFSTSDDPALVVRFQEKRDDGRLTVSIDTGVREEPTRNRLIKLETRLSRPVQGELVADFSASNIVLNDVFDRLIPKTERDRRFHNERG